MRRGRATVHNIVAVARREFVTRTSTRSFLISTIILVGAAVLIGLAPVVIGYIDRNSTTKVAVYVGATEVHGDPIASLDVLLNAQNAGTGAAGQAGERKSKAYTVVPAATAAGGLAEVRNGKAGAFIDVERDATGDLAFTIYGNDPVGSRTPELIRQATTSIAIQDRLGRAGLTPAQQANLFAPPSVVIRSADPNKTGSAAAGMTQEITNFAVVFGLVIFLFMAIILYGTWVAMSVVEEKSSRVMEIILGAATPFELLFGKVLGVGAAALLQYVAILGAAVVTLLLEGQIASIVLGETAGGLKLPAGLTPAVLVIFSVFFVLGFLLYAVLFAAAGSLVSRQEDVNQVITPMTLIATAGYLISLYATIGFIDLNAPWVILLSWVPFLSPYMILARVNAGTVGPAEVILAIVLLIVAIVGAAWVASRIYQAGVLMYGQRPSIRGMWKAVRTGR